MPYALQFGMTFEQFWHGDMYLYDVYHTAYERDVSYKAWVNGMYTKVATSQALSDGFKKEGSKNSVWPEFADPCKDIAPQSPQQVEVDHRSIMEAQSKFLMSRFNKE